MAHFAELDNDNVVLRVIVINNAELLDENGVESEARGREFCKSLYGENTNWIQSSYNASFRGMHAEAGGRYHADIDKFTPKAPEGYPSFVLDMTKLRWVPPKPEPTDGYGYFWDEEHLLWMRFTSKPRPDNDNLYLWNKHTEEWEQISIYNYQDRNYVWDPVTKNFVEQ